MHITLMHNPTAGQGQHSKEKLLQILREAGYDPTYQSTDEDDFPQALSEPGELVAIAGGDGTIDKVAQHLSGRNIPIGILPLGTANNIAKTLGITDSLEKLIAGWTSATHQKFDVGVVEAPWGTTHFIEAMGVGMFPQMMPLVSIAKEDHSFSSCDQELKYDLNAFKAMLGNYRAQTWQVTLDGQDCSGRYLLIEAMNIQNIGPNICVAPSADPGDGYFDVVFVSEEERKTFEHYLASCLNGEEKVPNFTIRRGKHLQLLWEGSEVHATDTLTLFLLAKKNEKPLSIIWQVA
ncbi:diacylglycerol kinase catalytic region [Stanieria cyanosphaera PCC 7437]|uniref:Diacylglycerol kinase catalytic region n=1 Tax=Stanieria cyanosphaera (strain ATCC 29371 / PCC 7437) TaxID=111780 RepID=K9XXL5_STAC7|nr:diacylglycerol kinase family protein [Stanieria cyanosphaera]AFZ37340.1 diacylglycerol kinase catalytic region [Stanieria cyanosphaera PCC 7437]